MAKHIIPLFDAYPEIWIVELSVGGAVTRETWTVEGADKLFFV